ncbi:MAG TPA: hypothetical protein VI643_04645 [Planctomycetota bacterium]|nr:hypothetical protein [Planctomycetota bacterium]
MSLSTEPVFALLQTKFVCGWRDISREPYCGKSGRHDLDNPAVLTTNGAGPTNTQLFILAADGTVLHCLPGYWDARDLACEIALADELHAIWRDGSLPREQKERRFREAHLAHIAKHPRDMVRRSRMQGFDQKFEARKEASDCIAVRTENGKVVYKTTDRIMHERIADQPFRPVGEFDVAACVKYGRPKYDKRGDDKEVEGGTPVGRRR